jgi:hypothetical protein
MASEFLKRFGAENGLTPTEIAILAAVDVRSYDEVASLVGSFPSIADEGLRLPFVSNAAVQHTSAAYASSAAQITSSPPPAPLGAEAPSGVSHNIHSIAGLPGQTTPPPPPTRTPIDLRLPGWGIRDQNPRGTCVAFGTTACIEHARSTIDGSLTDHSEQFLYWAIKTHTADPHPTQDGTRLEFADDALQNLGVCREHLWP